MNKDKKYRWATPYEWLEQASREWDENTLRHELLNLAIKHDMDTLQDEYQTEMDEDGYFKEMKG